MLNRKSAARIASLLLIVHGMIEVSGIFMGDSITHNLQSFGGMEPSRMDANALPIALLGVVWGLTRLIAAWGAWGMRKWGIFLGIAMSLVTLVAAVTIIPAGVADTILTTPVLILLLYTWFGNEVKEFI